MCFELYTSTVGRVRKHELAALEKYVCLDTVSSIFGYFLFCLKRNPLLEMVQPIIELISIIRVWLKSRFISFFIFFFYSFAMRLIYTSEKSKHNMVSFPLLNKGFVADLLKYASNSSFGHYSWTSIIIWVDVEWVVFTWTKTVIKN